MHTERIRKAFVGHATQIVDETFALETRMRPALTSDCLEAMQSFRDCVKVRLEHLNPEGGDD